MSEFVKPVKLSRKKRLIRLALNEYCKDIHRDILEGKPGCAVCPLVLSKVCCSDVETFWVGYTAREIDSIITNALGKEKWDAYKTWEKYNSN